MNVSSMAAAEGGLSAHDVLDESNENENLVEDGEEEEVLDQDEYELTELKNVGAECKSEPKDKEDDVRQDSPLEELTEEDDDSAHPSNGGGGGEEGRFVMTNRGGRTVNLVHSQPTSQQQQNQMAAQRDSLYLDQIQTVAQDVMISGYQTQRNPTTSHSTHRVVAQPPSSANGTPQGAASHGEGRPSVPSGSSGYYLLKTPSGGSGHVPIRIVHGADSHSSPGGARVTVVPATRSHNGTAVLQLPPGQMVRTHQRVQIIHTPSSSNQNNSHFNDHHRVSVGDPGVTVTERGSVGGGMHVVKKDQNGVSTMLVDNGSYYHNGSGQKVYRIINVQDDSAGLSGPPRKRMAIVPPRSQAQQQQEYKVNMVSMTPSTSRVPQLAQLNDEVIIDDGIQERPIDQDVNPPESPMLADSPGIGSMMISGHQSSLGPPSPGSHPGYLQQSQYDADLQFQQLISSSLSRLDENDKAVMKFHIQRILLEARYGVGISQRLLLQEDELENASNGVPHELVSQ